MKSPLRLLATLRTFNKQADLNQWASTELTQDLKAIEDALKNVGNEFGKTSENINSINQALLDQINNLQAQIDALTLPVAGAVGSYMFARLISSGAVNFGDTRPGADLRPSNVDNSLFPVTFSSSSFVPQGTWRCLGYHPGGSFQGVTLWLRIS